MFRQQLKEVTKVEGFLEDGIVWRLVAADFGVLEEFTGFNVNILEYL